MLRVWRPPSGPGVRLDAGFEAGDVIGGNFDSLLAKLIVTGRDRQEALERSRRALAEFDVEGIATAITFDRVVVEDPDFAPADSNEPSRSTRAGLRPTSTTQFLPMSMSRQATNLRRQLTARMSSSKLAASGSPCHCQGNLAIGTGGGAKKATAKRGKRKKGRRGVW